MTKLVIHDLHEQKALDEKALYSVRGGHSYGGHNPVNVDELLGKLRDLIPVYPVPGTPYEPASPNPSEPIPFGGPGPADGPL